MRSKQTRFALLFAAILLLAGGCAKPPEKPRVLWPPPPNQPRLEWLGTYHSQDDFEKTGTELALEKVTGKPQLTFFQRPFGIASDGKGIVYVSDVDARTVRIYDFNAREVQRLTKAPVFAEPFGLAVDSRGRLYVADAGRQSIAVFSAERQPLFAFGDPSLFQRPVHIALNERLGRIYVSDGKGHQIVVFDLEGRHLFSFGNLGRGEGEFFGPQGMAIDARDRLFVADQFNARIQVFDAEGKFLYFFGERGDQVSQFEFPKDLAFDSDGNLHVVDTRKAALITYQPDGKLLLYTGGKGGERRNPLTFQLPVTVFIDGQDKIHVADSMLRRFAVWQFFSEARLQQEDFPGFSRAGK